jgi:putative ABC transport system substrate-binding protein
LLNVRACAQGAPSGSRFSRRHRALVLALVVLALPVGIDAQPAPKVAKIGLLTPSSPAGSGHLVEAFRQGLRDLGYIDGKTVVVEARYGDGRSERLPELARGSSASSRT